MGEFRTAVGGVSEDVVVVLFFGRISYFSAEKTSIMK